VSSSVLSDNSDAATDGAGGGAINNEYILAVSDSTLSGNSDDSPGGPGGGAILNLYRLTVTNSTISDNTTQGSGGGIDNAGTNLQLTGSTLSNNTAPEGGGGGIQNDGGLNVNDSTLADNSAASGGAMWLAGPAYVYNSTVADNSAVAIVHGGTGNGLGWNFWTTSNAYVVLTASIIAEGATSGGDCVGPTHDLGYNIDDDGTCGLRAPSISKSTTLDSTVGPLASNGGPTQTIALFSGNPGIDYVPAADCPSTDQRGFARSAPCDIGAYDTDSGNQMPQTITFTSTSPSDATVNGPKYGVTATGGGSGNPVVFSSATTSVCTVSGSEVSFVGIGTCTIDADQAGSANYTSAPQVQQSFSVTAAVGPCGRTATRCFTSATGDSVTVGSSFSFSVTTAGSPSPQIKDNGKLPRGIRFHRGIGMASIAGTPISTKHRSAVGTYPLTITATFGRGKTRDVVTQAFTLTVVS